MMRRRFHNALQPFHPRLCARKSNSGASGPAGGGVTQTNTAVGGWGAALHRASIMERYD